MVVFPHDIYNTCTCGVYSRNSSDEISTALRLLARDEISLGLSLYLFNSEGNTQVVSIPYWCSVGSQTKHSEPHRLERFQKSFSLHTFSRLFLYSIYPATIALMLAITSYRYILALYIILFYTYICIHTTLCVPTHSSTMRKPKYINELAFNYVYTLVI